MKKQIEERMRVGRWLWEEEAGTIVPEHREELQRWLDRSPEHQALAESIRNDFKNHIKDNLDDPRASWRIFESRHLNRKKPRLIMIMRRMAAAIILFFTAGTYLLLHKTQQNDILISPQRSQAVLILDDGRQIELGRGSAVDANVEIVHDNTTDIFSIVGRESSEVQFNTIYVPQHGDCRIKLPDGSTATINSRSKLRYPSLFGDGVKEVWLDGEAFFDIVDQDESSFIVHFWNGNVEVLGTKFNVEAYPENLVSTTTLLAGSVRCFNDAGSRIIAPGQQASIETANGNITVSDADVRMATAWTRNQFYFKNQRLEDVINELADWYEFDIVYSDPALKELLFTVEINRYENLTKLLDFIAETGKIKYKQSGRIITIY